MLANKEIIKVDSSKFRIKQSSIHKKSKTVSHFKIGDKIGQGGFATVHKAIELHTGMEVAVKIVSLGGFSSKDLDNLKREIKIHQKLKFPHIVRIFESVWRDDHVYIFMELVEGRELFDYLKENGPIPEKKAVKIFYQIVKTVEYLHSIGIAHRDIKTENIILDKSFNAKLIDFGLAKSFSDSDGYLTTFCGSPSYTSPEILSKKRYDGRSVDIWCLGVTLYVLLEACLPFDDFGNKLREKNIQQLKWHKSEDSPKEAIELYSAIFTEEKNRITLDNILTSSLFAQNRVSEEWLQKDKFEVNEEVCTKIIKGASLLLKIPEDVIKSEIELHKIGEILCVYELSILKNNESNAEERSRLTKSELRRQSFQHKKTITLSPKSQKKSLSKEFESPIINMLPIINDSMKAKYRESEDLHKIAFSKCELIANFDLNGKDNGGKSNPRFKSNSRLKGMLKNEIDVKVNKARLRENSPDSPKRILDCVRIYS